MKKRTLAFTLFVLMIIPMFFTYVSYKELTTFDDELKEFYDDKLTPHITAFSKADTAVHAMYELKFMLNDIDQNKELMHYIDNIDKVNVFEASHELYVYYCTLEQWHHLIIDNMNRLGQIVLTIDVYDMPELNKLDEYDKNNNYNFVLYLKEKSYQVLIPPVVTNPDFGLMIISAVVSTIVFCAGLANFKATKPNKTKEEI